MGMQGMSRVIKVGSAVAAEVHSSCGTCPFLFTVAPEGVDASALVTAAREETEFGIDDLSSPVVDDIGAVLPSGNYHVALFRALPQRVGTGSTKDYFAAEGLQGWPGLSWAGPSSGRSNYYRSGTTPVSVPYDRDATLFEFIVPLQPRDNLDPQRIDHYRQLLRSGYQPTAIALSAYDSKASWDVDVEHFILSNYLVDGHHKTEAAHLEDTEITLLAFISTRLAAGYPLEAYEAIAGGGTLHPSWSPEGMNDTIAAVAEVFAKHNPLATSGLPPDIVQMEYRYAADALIDLLAGFGHPPGDDELAEILAEECRDWIGAPRAVGKRLAAIAQDLRQRGLA